LLSMPEEMMIGSDNDHCGSLWFREAR
jgi:hypothetical protein